jgi:hypothetical protein
VGVGTVSSDGTFSGKCSIMSLKTPDNALIQGLDMRGKIGSKILDTDLGELIRWCVSAKIVLKEQDIPLLSS